MKFFDGCPVVVAVESRIEYKSVDASVGRTVEEFAVVDGSIDVSVLLDLGVAGLSVLCGSVASAGSVDFEVTTVDSGTTVVVEMFVTAFSVLVAASIPNGVLFIVVVDVNVCNDPSVDGRGAAV